jgi:predicted flap endonuclease-1-like 5' DNA nuclease
MKIPKFLVGILIGGLLGIIFWYWQKSTSAEDGALSVLDRLAASEAHVRELEARLRKVAADPTAPSKTTNTIDFSAGMAAKAQETADDLQEIDGIGPTYAGRLQEGGVNTFAALANQTSEQIMEISGVRSQEMADSWIREARERLSG